MNNICSFTGHRDLPQNKINNIIAAIEQAIEQAVKDGYKHFISGGARGVDIIAARLVTEQIDFDSSITLELCLPYPDFINNYDYAYLRPYCSKITYVSSCYHISTFYKRDKVMVDNSDRIICVFDNTPKGGTYNTMQYALNKDIEMILIDINNIPEDI